MTPPHTGLYVLNNYTRKKKIKAEVCMQDILFEKRGNFWMIVDDEAENC